MLVQEANLRKKCPNWSTRCLWSSSSISLGLSSLLSRVCCFCFTSFSFSIPLVGQLKVQVVLLNLQEADMFGADYRGQECARQFFAHVNNLDSTSSIKASGCLPHLNSNRWEQKLQDGIIGSIHLCDDPIKPFCTTYSQKEKLTPFTGPFDNI